MSDEHFVFVGCVIGFFIGVMLLLAIIGFNSESTLIRTEFLDNVCNEKYGQDYNFYEKTKIGANRKFICRNEDKQDIILYEPIETKEVKEYIQITMEID